MKCRLRFPLFQAPEGSRAVSSGSMVYSLSPAKSCTVPYPRCPCSHPRHLAPLRIRASASLPEPNGAKVEYTPWLVAGLGNPGNKYHGTRHNVGFEMIDQISQEEGILLNTIQSKALIGIGSIGEVPVVLAKPQTYMNFSGESVGQLAAYYQVPLRHILLVHDEMSLPNSVLRLKPKRGHGHHNGFALCSCEQWVGSAFDYVYKDDNHASAISSQPPDLKWEKQSLQCSERNTSFEK
nr:chloroplastic group IIB intron splicing facilitator CRS2-B, chloroplastic [Ipomoea batatas]